MSREIIGALQALEEEKGIPKEVLLDALEAALVSAYRRNFGSAQNSRVQIDRQSGEVKVFARKTVVETIQDPRVEISLEESQRHDPRYQIGDVVEVEVTPADFGRIAAQTARQVVMQKLHEAERDIIYDEFYSRQGDILTGVVQRHEGKNVFIDLGKTEALLPAQEQIPGERYRHGDRIKCLITNVKKANKGPQVEVSRTHPGLVARLFELEVPEVHDGIVEIKAVAREPGSRSKIAVSSRAESVDPVGACVGPKGMRVQAVVSELRGEKIDILRWDPRPEQFIANALGPARVSSVELLPDEHTARVIVPDNQLSLAIGKEGQNAKLAARLTGYRIDIKSETQMAELRDAAAAAAARAAAEPAPVAAEPAAEEAARPEERAALEEQAAIPAGVEVEVPAAAEDQGAEDIPADDAAGEEPDDLAWLEEAMRYQETEGEEEKDVFAAGSKRKSKARKKVTKRRPRFEIDTSAGDE